jgi:FdhD protein
MVEDSGDNYRIMIGPKQSVQVILVEENRAKQKRAEIIVETPVSLTINGEIWLTLMCTPVDLEYLAAGFLFNEGVIQSAKEIASIHVCDAGDNIDLWLQHKAEKPSKWRRTSGCTGGITSVDANMHASNIHSHNADTITPNQVSRLVEALFESQDIYRVAGGVHTSALSDGQIILAVAEDIGRHNTMDKIAGRCMMEHINSSEQILITTGRISSEMLQKADRMDISIVISRTSPSSLSIQMAEQWGITLIGYARRNSFRIYAHPERILLDPNSKRKEVVEIHVPETEN